MLQLLRYVAELKVCVAAAVAGCFTGYVGIYALKNVPCAVLLLLLLA